MGANTGLPEKYHVLFFGDVVCAAYGTEHTFFHVPPTERPPVAVQPQRAWIAAKNLQLWEGPKGGDSSLREPGNVPKKYSKDWQPALRFAEEAYKMPHLQRLGAFGWIEDLTQLESLKVSDLPSAAASIWCGPA